MVTSITSIPISKRSKGTFDKLYVYLYCTLLTAGLAFCHLSQLLLYPLSYIPGGSREFYYFYIRQSKLSFARVLTYLSRSTTLEITGDDSINLNELVGKDEDGYFELKLSKRAVFISNHQCYSDWLYVWILFYFSGIGGGIIIVLKKSLRSIPIASWAMRLWDFIFLSTWEVDRDEIGSSLLTLGKRATKHDRPLALLLYPEGTLVSALTRPKSEAYAKSSGIPDMKNLLLPRSTGLLYCLRTLSTVVPDLAFYDITIGYPGVNQGGYAQSYYTLQSIYPLGQAPTSVHIHIRKYPLSTVPIGKIEPKLALTPEQLFDSVTEEEKDVFDLWVRERWNEKDDLMNEFYKNGKFKGEEKDQSRILIKSELKGIDDWLAIFSNLLAPYIVYLLVKHGHKYVSTIFESGLPTLF